MFSKNIYLLLPKFRQTVSIVTHFTKRNISNEKLSSFKEKVNKGPHLSEFLIADTKNDSLASIDSDPPPYVLQTVNTDRKGFIP